MKKIILPMFPYTNIQWTTHPKCLELTILPKLSDDFGSLVKNSSKTVFTVETSSSLIEGKQKGGLFLQIRVAGEKLKYPQMEQKT